MNRITHYLGHPRINEAVYLTKNHELRFHWADYSKTIDYFRSLIDRRKEFPEFDQSYRAHLNDINKMKEKRIWISTPLRKISTSMYDLYAHLLSDKHKKPELSMALSDPDCGLSLHGKKSHYHGLTSYRWYKKSLFHSMVYHLLFSEEIPERSFRLRVESDILADIYTQGSWRREVLKLTQISGHGLLLNGTQEALNGLKTADEAAIYLNKVGIDTLCNLDHETELTPPYPVDQQFFHSDYQGDRVFLRAPELIAPNNDEDKRFAFINYDNLENYPELKMIMNNLLTNTEVAYSKYLEKQLKSED